MSTKQFSLQHRILQNIAIRAAVCLLVGATLFCVGCNPPPRRSRPRTRDSNAETLKEADTDFRVAFDFLDNFHQFDPKSVGQQITYHLQRWISNQQPDPDWIADPLLTRLPKRFSGTRKDDFLSKLRFDADAFDVVILREAIWSRDLARQIDAARLHDATLADWLEGQANEMNGQSLAELETAAKIFDWTVRNIQLVRLPYARPDEDDENASNLVVPPDGAMYLPAEALMTGRGDWIARMRVANLIARQAGLATAVMAIDQDSGEEEPWCWAVLIEGQLYLFDFRLGLPIPVQADGQGIATLADVIDKPELLRSLDLPSDDSGHSRTYPVSDSDLKGVVALIDASQESLSQRMKIVERQLTGDRRLVLTSSPSAFAIDLRNSPGITGARLWTMAFEVYLFRQNLKDSMFQAQAAGTPLPLVPQQMVKMHQDMKIVDGQGRLSLPRRQHFRGNYADTENEDGAKAAYLACRIPDSVIAQKIDLDAMYEQGIIPLLPQDEATRQLVIDGLRQRMRDSKQYASFWLGLIAFEEGKYKVAINYLEKRVLNADPDGPWTESATYNLARAYEQLGLESKDEAMLIKSRELLRSLRKAPQAEGNRLRAASE